MDHLNNALMESITSMSEYFVAVNTRTKFTEIIAEQQTNPTTTTDLLAAEQQSASSSSSSQLQQQSDSIDSFSSPTQIFSSETNSLSAGKSAGPNLLPSNSTTTRNNQNNHLNEPDNSHQSINLNIAQQLRQQQANNLLSPKSHQPTASDIVLNPLATANNGNNISSSAQQQNSKTTAQQNNEQQSVQHQNSPTETSTLICGTNTNDNNNISSNPRLNPTQQQTNLSSENSSSHQNLTSTPHRSNESINNINNISSGNNQSSNNNNNRNSVNVTNANMNSYDFSSPQNNSNLSHHMLNNSSSNYSSNNSANNNLHHQNHHNMSQQHNHNHSNNHSNSLQQDSSIYHPFSTSSASLSSSELDPPMRYNQPMRTQIPIHCFIEQLDACAELPTTCYNPSVNDNDLFRTTINSTNSSDLFSASNKQRNSQISRPFQTNNNANNANPSHLPHLHQSKLALESVTNCNGNTPTSLVSIAAAQNHSTSNSLNNLTNMSLYEHSLNNRSTNNDHTRNGSNNNSNNNNNASGASNNNACNNNNNNNDSNNDLELESIDANLDHLDQSPLSTPCPMPPNDVLPSSSLRQSMNMSNLVASNAIISDGFSCNDQRQSTSLSTYNDNNIPHQFRSCRETYAIVTSNVLYIDLVRTVLLQLGYSAMDLINAKGKSISFFPIHTSLPNL